MPPEQDKMFAGVGGQQSAGQGDQQQQQPSDDGLPEELKGKSAAEVYRTLGQEHERLMTEQAQAIRQEVEQHLGQQRQQPPQQTPQQTQQTEEEPTLWSDADAFMEKQFERRVNPLVQTQLQQNRETNRALFEMRNKEAWDEYGDEIEQFVNGASPAAQAHPKVYDTAYTYVLGAHHKEIVEKATSTRAKELAVEMLQEMGIDTGRLGQVQGPEQDQQQQRRSLFEPVTGVASAPRQPTPPSFSPSRNGGSGNRGRLSPDEKRMAERFGMTDEEWIAEKSENTDIISETMRGAGR